jgi:hypothetical protein
VVNSGAYKQQIWVSVLTTQRGREVTEEAAEQQESSEALRDDTAAEEILSTKQAINEKFVQVEKYGSS